MNCVNSHNYIIDVVISVGTERGVHKKLLAVDSLRSSRDVGAGDKVDCLASVGLFNV